MRLESARARNLQTQSHVRGWCEHSLPRATSAGFYTFHESPARWPFLLCHSDLPELAEERHGCILISPYREEAWDYHTYCENDLPTHLCREATSRKFGMLLSTPAECVPDETLGRNQSWLAAKGVW